MQGNNDKIVPFNGLQLGNLHLSTAKDANGHPIYYLEGIFQSGQDRFKVAFACQKVS